MLTLARRLSIAAALGMLIVLLMGAMVTKTGSGMGCGRSWPLCNGEFIPEYAFETAVEYSHRLVTSIEGLLLLGACITSFRFRRQLPELKVLIPVTFVTLIVQSGMGAAAVMWPQSAIVLASHFGISLTALASTSLMAFVLREGPGRGVRDDAAIPSRYRWMSAFTILAMLGVAYLGAFVRHTKSSLACTTWPLCNGKVLGGLDWSERIVVTHRIVALLGILLVLGMWLWARRFATRPDLSRAGGWAVALILAQALSGAFLPWSNLSFASTMTHALIMALLFVVCCEWCRRALPRPVPAAARQALLSPAAAAAD
ncbi:MAG: COX15/CtaA family protein [Chloroflexota bacterium]